MKELMGAADGATMTSLEIAKLVGKQHKHVLRDIKAMVEGLKEDGPDMDHELRQGLTHEKDARGYLKMVSLNKELTLTLTSGYSVTQRNAIIKRWLSLEDSARIPPAIQPRLPTEIGEATIMSMLRVAVACGTPKSYAIQVAGAEATRQTGMPWDKLLTQAEAMNDVPIEDVMLEPTELGKLFDTSAVAMNRKLKELGLQEKRGGQWMPTEAGAKLCKQHAWVSHGKSGYNLKWNAAEIETLVEKQT